MKKMSLALTLVAAGVGISSIASAASIVRPPQVMDVPNSSIVRPPQVMDVPNSSIVRPPQVMDVPNSSIVRPPQVIE